MKPKAALSEIKTFIESLRLDSSSVDPEDPISCRIYRRFHAMLLFDLLLDRDCFSDLQRLYAREFAADFSTAYFLTLIGIYKSARLSLRSGIENLIRVHASLGGVDVETLTTVAGLVTKSRAISVTNNQMARIDSIYALYGELCQTVHSTSVDYMSLRVPFERIAESEKIKLQANLSNLELAMKLSNEVLLVSLWGRLKLLDYKNADLLRDAVEASVKAEAAEAGLPGP